MKNFETGRKSPTAVIAFPVQKRKKKAPLFAGAAASATAGNLALSLGLTPAPNQKPLRFPAPSRWFSESHGAIGFRLFDIVYLFALARQALEPGEALEWACRYFNGAWSDEHGRTVVEILSPGMGDEVEAGEIPDHIRQGFRDAVCQGAGRLLRRTRLRAEDITWEEAVALQQKLEELYARNGWLLPAMPLTLHRMLRFSSKMFDY
jgi:hypothetical protein